jgi:hypothetical protein
MEKQPFGVPGGTNISYMSFLHGAALFSCLRSRGGVGRQSPKLVRAKPTVPPLA